MRKKIVKRYGKYGRMASWIVKWNGIYGWKASWIMKIPYFSISFHYSTCLSSILSISYHYSTDFSSIFSISFHYFLPYFPYLFPIFFENCEKIW
jgi:hypothetical protein